MKQTLLGGAPPSLASLFGVVPPPKPKQHRAEKSSGGAGVKSQQQQQGCGKQQLNLDMGQRVVGVEACPKCGMHFQRTPEDIRIHEKHCHAKQSSRSGSSGDAAAPAALSWGALSEALSKPPPKMHTEKSAAVALRPTVAAVAASWCVALRNASPEVLALIDAWYLRVRRGGGCAVKGEESQAAAADPVDVELGLACPMSLNDLLISPVLSEGDGANISVAVAVESVGGEARAVGIAIYVVTQKQVPVCTVWRPEQQQQQALDAATPHSSQRSEPGGDASDTASDRSESPDPQQPVEEGPQLVVATSPLMLMDLLWLPADVKFASKTASFFGPKVSAQPPAAADTVKALLALVETQAVYGCKVSRETWVYPKHLLRDGEASASAPLPHVLSGQRRILSASIIPPSIDIVSFRD